MHKTTACVYHGHVYAPEVFDASSRYLLLGTVWHDEGILWHESGMYGRIHMVH